MITELRRRLAWQVLLIIAIPFAVVAVTFALLIGAMTEQRSAGDRALDAARSIARAGRLEGHLRELQAGARGFLVTGDSRFLEPYKEALASYKDETRRLEKGVMTTGGRDHAAAIARKIDSYVNDYLRGVVAVGHRDLRAARRIVARGQGERRATALGRHFNELQASERRSAENERDRADASVDRAIAIAIGGLGISALVVAAFGLYLRQSVVIPVRQLSRAASRVEDGDLSARVPPSRWQNELGRLTHSFNEMAAGLQQSWDAAREAERSKDEFFALVSHELRTPLTSIVGYTDLLADVDGERLSDEGRRFVEVINRNAERQMRLVGDLLLLVRIQEGTFAVELGAADLEAIVQGAVDDARVAAHQKDITLSLKPDHTPPMRGDTHRLGQMIENLLSNAIKFTPRGGRVTARLTSTPETATIEVEDSGVGITTAQLERLFERAYRASTAKEAQTPGLGLGLTIVKAIVEQHGGRIRVESEEGAGTTFRVELPVEGPDQA